MAASCAVTCSKCVFSFKNTRSLLRVNHRWYARGLRRRIVNILTPEQEEALILKKKGCSKDKLRLAGAGGDTSQVQELGVGGESSWGCVDDDESSKYYRKGQEGETGRLPKLGQTDIEKSKGKKMNPSRVPVNFQFEKIQENDKRFGTIIMNTKSRKNREKTQEILVEGCRLILDALEAGAHCKSLFFSKKDALVDFPIDQLGCPMYKIQYKHMKLWSDVVTPSGVMAVFTMPSQGEVMAPQTKIIPLTLICDGIRDPGNMGTLIRTAAAVGCEKILVTKGCVDIWEPKVLRAAAGCNFRIPIYSHLSWDVAINYLEPSTQVYLASSAAAGQAQGKAVKQLLDLQSSNNVDLDDYEMDERTRKLYDKAPLPISWYHKVDFSKQNIALVVGGETEGLSPHAKKLAFDKYGCCLSIPMAGGVNSLNSTIAASIIMYEIRKQVSETSGLSQDFP